MYTLVRYHKVVSLLSANQTVSLSRLLHGAHVSYGTCSDFPCAPLDPPQELLGLAKYLLMKDVLGHLDNEATDVFAAELNVIFPIRPSTRS